VDGFHTSRGLHGERRDGRDAIAVLRRECFKIRGNARAGGWIETRDRQHDGRSRIYVIGQFFEPLRDKNRPQTSGPAAQKGRASRQLEMYARERPRAIEIFRNALLEKNNSTRRELKKESFVSGK
jgi:hypothetical protein